MPVVKKNTVDRLDKASSYASSKVCARPFRSEQRKLTCVQKRRNRYREDDRREPSPDPDEKLKDATTLYVGNLSFYTTEEQIHELFSKCVTFPDLRQFDVLTLAGVERSSASSWALIVSKRHPVGFALSNTTTIRMRWIA